MNLTYSPCELSHSHFVHLIPPTLARVDELYLALTACDKNHFRYLPWAQDETSREIVYSNMQEAIDNYVNDKEEYRFLIIDTHTDSLVGCAGLFIRNAKIPFYEIGYWLTSASIGKGFATEAVNQLKTFAFTTLNAKRLEIRMSGSHSKSRNVAIRGGFQLEAQLCCDRMNPDGSLDNTCIFSIVN